MMIQKIKQIKKFGIFHDFSWPTDLSDFKQFNLVYGWNRSGKTTLSRVFSSCEGKTVFADYSDGEFKIKMEDGTEITAINVGSSDLPIKVFNSEFIKENIFFDDQEKHCNPIVYISEEDIESKNKLDQLKKDQEQLDKDFKDAETLRKEKERAEDNFRISIAREISNVLFWKSYDKRKAKERIDEIGIENFTQLSDEDVKKAKKMTVGDAKQALGTFADYEFSFYFDGATISSYQEVFPALKGVLEKKVVSETLERLKKDPELNNWVKQGFGLQKKKAEETKCLFCEQTLPPDLLEGLSKHFSKDYEELQSEIETLSNELGKLKPNKIPAQKTELYSDLQTKYKDAAKKLNDLIEEIEKWVNTATSKLAEKKKDPFVDVEIPEKPKDFETKYNDVVKELNQIIGTHNTRSANHGEEVGKAKAKLENHYLAVAIEEQDYAGMVKELEGAKTKEAEAKGTRNKNSMAIIALEEQTSNTGKALPKINKFLEDFFGQKEVQLELDDESKGYILKRNGEVAKNLSEGEKTAIAFSYFMTKVQEKDFKVTEGIIFIDDPISSFDSNFIYHCFSVIKNHFKDAGQLFISTHNFEFFNLVKEWFCKKNNKKKSKGKDPICEFYMIENEVDSGKRKAYAAPLDETLRDFKSEYHFLFHLLNEFVETDSDEYKKFYIIGNIARRFLEIFTNFKVPSTGDLASKLGELQTTTVTGVERDKVYKLINDFSHFTDPVGMVEHKDKSECKEAVEILLRIVKEADSKHFEILKREINNTTSCT